nr:hypothetical protein Q903MT_gene4959 [Picea sitchensis]
MQLTNLLTSLGLPSQQYVISMAQLTSITRSQSEFPNNVDSVRSSDQSQHECNIKCSTERESGISIPKVLV